MTVELRVTDWITIQRALIMMQVQGTPGQRHSAGRVLVTVDKILDASYEAYQTSGVLRGPEIQLEWMDEK